VLVPLGTAAKRCCAALRAGSCRRPQRLPGLPAPCLCASVALKALAAKMRFPLELPLCTNKEKLWKNTTAPNFKPRFLPLHKTIQVET